ncbi:uncharacterized protein BDV17DRAFT_268064 [Aspergillus undulatus]|uniref:uncharacterized protein n=1 Tax=Aspergillus undulatus TaxID=1810928 RepID=UPI003CCE087F
MNFQLASATNGMALCANCHYEYDNHYDPQLIFYPCDIQFFIRFELRDRQRRKNDGSARRAPTSAQYVQWCGLYNRIHFNDDGKGKVVVHESAEWKGAPMAAFQRTFGIMGGVRAAGIPESDMEDLRMLWNLYSTWNDDDGSLPSSWVTDRFPPGTDGLSHWAMILTRDTEKSVMAATILRMGELKMSQRGARLIWRLSRMRMTKTRCRLGGGRLCQGPRRYPVLTICTGDGTLGPRQRPTTRPGDVLKRQTMTSDSPCPE